MALSFEDLMKSINNSGSDVDVDAYTQPPVQGSVMSPGTGAANQNFLSMLLNSKSKNPADLYGAASAASAPFQSPTDTGGGMVPQRLPELKSNGPVVGVGDSLTQRPGDDIPKPVDEGKDLEELSDDAPVQDITRRDAVVDQAKVPVAETQVDPLIDAQNRSNTLAGLMMAVKGAERAGAGLSRTKSDPNYLDEMKPLINRPVEDVQAQRQAAGQELDQNIKKFNFDFAKDKNDPESDSSVFYRTTMKTLSDQAGINLNIPDTLSAAEMEKLYPNLINIVNSKEAREARIQAAQEIGQQKQGKSNDHLIDAMKKDLDPNQARGGNLAKSQAMVNSADRVDALFTQFPDYNIPKGQTIELSSAIAGLVNGGSAQSQHQIDSLTPASMRGNFSAMAGWLTNDPRGLGQQKFMQLMHETALRERDVATDQVKSAQIQRLPAYKKLLQTDPDTYNALLLAAHLDPSMIDQKGQYIRPGKNPSSNSANLPQPGESVNKGGLTLAQDAGVTNFMKANKITNKADAIKILKDAGKL